MLRKLTVLASIFFTVTLNAENVPIPVPQAVQNAYSISDMKRGHYDDPRGRYWVVDNGVLYTMNTSLYAQPQTPTVHNVVKDGTLLPYHARVMDYIVGSSKGKKIKQGELFYLSKIAVEKTGLVFTFESWSIYLAGSFVNDTGASFDTWRRAHMEVRFALAPAQIAALTPQSVRQMTDPFFTPSSTSVHPPIITPEYGW